MTVLLQVMTLFLLIIAGFFAAKKGILDDRGLRGLNTLVLNFAQPALILHKMQMPTTPQLIIELAWVFVLTCLTIGVAGVIAFRLFAAKNPAMISRNSVITCSSTVMAASGS